MSNGPLFALSRLTDALSRATTLAAIYEAALDALEQGLAVTRSSVLLFDENEVMSFVAWRGLSDDYRAAVNGHSPWRPGSQDVAPITVSDVAADATLASFEDVFAREGIRALGFFPLCYRDRVLGKFMLYYAEPHLFSKNEIELARAIAGQIAFGVARIRAEIDLERERRRLSDIIANVPGVVWETIGPADGSPRRIRFVSPRMVDLLGYPLEQWYSGSELLANVNVDPPEVVQAARERSTSSEQAVLHMRMRRADGTIISTEARTASQREGDEIVVRGVTIDVTAQQQAERRTELLAQASAVLGSSLDYEQTLDHVAHLLASMMDWEVRMQCGADIPVCAPTDRNVCRTHSVSAPIAAGGNLFGTITVASSHPFDDHDRTMLAELGRRVGYAVGNARLYREAQEANRAKDEFLATLSHELRTPMTATLGWATMLRTMPLSPDNTQLAIETIERSTRAQAKLIDEILDVSRIVTGKLQLTIAPVNLTLIVEAAVEAIRPSITAKDLQLQLDLAPIDGPPTGDAARLQQVIWNLLSNSVKFTPPGGSIALTVDQPEPGAVRIHVRDSGMGISAKFLPHIFERFRQADSSSTRKHGGLGLGLAIVKSIVELHGGNVRAMSEGEGRGAAFTITLPIRTLPAATAVSAPSEAAAPTLAGIAVLLVEDEEDTRTMLAAALQDYGASVTAVASVPDALAAMAEKTPHVVVSDIGMPDEDGYSLMMKIRAGNVARRVPAVALTAYARPEDKARALESGFAYHLAKPVDPLMVVKTVKEAFTRSV